MIGSGISGTLSLFSAVEPFVGFLAGPAGVIVAGTLKGIGNDIKERQLSPREDYRVGKVLAITALEIHQRLENGEKLRNDGYFDKKINGRSDAEEVAEAILLKSQREPQEKKIQYMGYMQASFAFNTNINPNMQHQLIKAAEELTYRQFCILKLAVVKNSFGLRAEDYRGHGSFAIELLQILYECLDLYHRAYINFGGEVAFGPTDVKPGSMTAQGLGAELFNHMKLSSIPDEDIIPIAKVLK